MTKRIGTVLSVMKNRARVEFYPEAETAPRSDVSPAPCCRPDTAPDLDQQVEALSAVEVHSGDRVEVLVPEPRSLAARLAPIWPALALPVAGSVIGGMVQGDVGAGIGIAAGLALGVIGALLVGRRMGGGTRDLARVLRVVGPAAPGEHCAVCTGSSERR
jgi:positive regulator of sigma E activity